MENKYLLIIDGSSLLTTQFYGNIPREILFAKTPEEKEKYFYKIMKTSKGAYTNAVFGFLRALFHILIHQKPTYLAITWDVTRETFRRRLYADYKGNRDETMAPLKDQFVLCQEVLGSLGIAQFMSEEYEADDYAGTLSRLFENEVPIKILTKDHDYLQLVNDKTHLWMLFPSADKADQLFKKYHLEKTAAIADRAFEFDPALVKAEFEVEPRFVNSLKGLEGDPSDNIKGVPGIGHVTAVKLVNTYGTVGNLYEAIGEPTKEKEASLKQYWKEHLGLTRSPFAYLIKTSETELVGKEAGLLSEKLATIKTDIDLGDLSLEKLKIRTTIPMVEAVVEQLEFKSFLKDLPNLGDCLNGYYEDTATAYFDYQGLLEPLSDFSETEELLSKLASEKQIGFSMDEEKNLYIADEKAIYTIPHSLFFFDGLDSAFLSRLFAGKTVAGWNSKSVYKELGLPIDDVSIMAYLLDPLKGDYTLTGVVNDRTLSNIRLSAAALENDRALLEAFAARSLYPSLKDALIERGMWAVYQDMDLPTSYVLSEMEEKGIFVDRRAMDDFSADMDRRLHALEDEICSLAGESFNIQSPKQLGEILFGKLSLPFGKKTKSGYSTNADVLDKLKNDYPIVAKVLEYRTYAKLRSTYTGGLVHYIQDDGRIHTTFHQCVTATGRLSSADPNLQNIPVRTELGSSIRKMFIPSPGNVFVDADYSQIELRILSHMSGDESLQEAYLTGQDIHTLTASKIFHVAPENVTPELRRRAKAVNFGIVYGISAFSLSEDIGTSVHEADDVIRRYFATFPKVKAYLDRVKEEAYQSDSVKPFVKTIYGRIRPIPELRSSDYNQVKFGERVAMNSPIQGTAADIMKIAMIQVSEALKAQNLAAKIVLQIHDELLIECPPEEAETVQQILTERMEQAVSLSVPLTVECKVGDSWYDCK